MTSRIESTRAIAPEDLSVGRYVAVLHEISEYHFRDCECGVRTLRTQEVPSYTDYPVKVASVCLPFVFVETANGETDILDVRRQRLGAVPARFAAGIHDRVRRADKR